MDCVKRGTGLESDERNWIVFSFSADWCRVAKALSLQTPLLQPLMLRMNGPWSVGCDARMNTPLPPFYICQFGLGA